MINKRLRRKTRSSQNLAQLAADVNGLVVSNGEPVHGKILGALRAVREQQQQEAK